VILARFSRVGARSSRLRAAHAAVGVLDIQDAQSLRKSRWNGEERGSAFLPLWPSDSADLVEWPQGDALDAIDRG
jgi:hypothetical protein